MVLTLRRRVLLREGVRLPLLFPGIVVDRQIMELYGRDGVSFTISLSSTNVFLKKKQNCKNMRKRSKNHCELCFAKLRFKICDDPPFQWGPLVFEMQVFEDARCKAPFPPPVAEITESYQVRLTGKLEN
ncbi:hypothetical protein C4D60_Mb02t20150 [Musa balbisiana]|uniref:Uncharacterized protein n=1 Tax=Musa balbisiana TaxID=52838 RepID=A0A4S8IDD6_MUSBA|nr:hypothetical protein C4D60_Mb02t20150 [Musa balbisiana]